MGTNRPMQSQEYNGATPHTLAECPAGTSVRLWLWEPSVAVA